MATQYIKFTKKCKNFFSKIIGGAMAPFGQGVATPMCIALPFICFFLHFKMIKHHMHFPISLSKFLYG